jgi:hypothetical protein
MTTMKSKNLDPLSAVREAPPAVGDYNRALTRQQGENFAFVGRPQINQWLPRYAPVLERPGQQADYWEMAQHTHQFTKRTFLLGPESESFDPADHEPKRRGSYRADLAGNKEVTDTWYNSTQIIADASMVVDPNGLIDASYLDLIVQTHQLMSQVPKDPMDRFGLWDTTTPDGGFFGTIPLDGLFPMGATKESRGLKFIDDNALMGIALLEAYDASKQAGQPQEQLRQSAKDVGILLMSTYAYDDVLGGGHWWCGNHDFDDKQHPIVPANKPTNANALAAIFMFMLYHFSEDDLQRDKYRIWANKVLAWMRANLRAGDSHLYNRWKDKNGMVDPSKYTDHNAEAIEAFVWSYLINNRQGDLTEAQQIADDTIKFLWDPKYEGFVLKNSLDMECSDGIDPQKLSLGQLSPYFSGWASRAFIKLYEADQNPKWLDWAEHNVKVLNSRLRTASGGYRFGWCSGDFTSGALDKEGLVDGKWTVLERGLVQLDDQAMMQHVLARLALYR